MPTFERGPDGRAVTRFEPRCKRCNGTGQILVETPFRSRYNGAMMSFAIWDTCAACKGFGFLAEAEGRR